MERLHGIVIAVVVGLCCASPLHAKTVHSSDLGWKPGQDITAKFRTLLGSGRLKAGDELVLDHTYRISGTHRLPDGFTLSAKKGAGFEVTDAKTNNRPLLEMGNNTTLRNLTIVYLNTPELGGRGYKHGVDFFKRVGISASGKSDILIENCRLEGMIAHHIRLGDCKRVKIIGCRIIGGFWAVCLMNDSDLVFRNCLFEKSCCDGIKTTGDGVVRKVLVENCIFQDNCRDGIDTTGGFDDAVVRNCIFRRLGATGLDLKSTYNGPGRPKGRNLLVEKCLFTDIPNAMVFTTGHRDAYIKSGGKPFLTAANIKTYAVHDIDINDCTFGYVEKPLRPSVFGKDMDPDKYGYGVKYPRQGEHMRLFLVKDAYNIRYKNARLFGDRAKIMPVLLHSVGGGRSLPKEAAEALDQTTKIKGNILDEPATPPKPGDTTVPFACGPQPLEASEN